MITGEYQRSALENFASIDAELGGYSGDRSKKSECLNMFAQISQGKHDIEF